MDGPLLVCTGDGRQLYLSLRLGTEGMREAVWGEAREGEEGENEVGSSTDRARDHQVASAEIERQAKYPGNGLNRCGGTGLGFPISHGLVRFKCSARMYITAHRGNGRWSRWRAQRDTREAAGLIGSLAVYCAVWQVY